MSLQTFYTCPADCDTELLLPAIDEVQDCTNYDILDSQVCDLIIVPDGAPDPFDWTDPDEPALVANGIDNTVTDNSKAKRLVGEGGVAEPEEEIGEYPKLKDKVVKRTFTLVFNIKNMSQSMYAFLQAIECGTTSYTIYYANLAGYLFGKATGIEIKSAKATAPLGAARGDKQIGTITITWESAGMPNRYPSPLA